VQAIALTIDELPVEPSEQDGAAQGKEVVFSL
jgi:hypothetical protein